MAVRVGQSGIPIGQVAPLLAVSQDVKSPTKALDVLSKSACAAGPSGNDADCRGSCQPCAQQKDPHAQIPISNGPSVLLGPDVNDRFRIDAGGILGQGTCVHVFKGLDTHKKCEVAIRHNLLSIRHLSDLTAFTAQFKRLRALQHEHVVKTFGVDLSPTRHRCLIGVELMSQGSVYSIIERGGNFRLHESKIRDYFQQALAGLAFLHSKNLIHNDITEDTLLVNSEGVLKLSGVCTMNRIIEEAGIEVVEERPCSGLFIFCSPETFKENITVGKQTDIWSLACVVVMMATGRLPWTHILDDPTHSSIVAHLMRLRPPDHHPLVPSHLSECLKAMLSMMFSFDPEARPSAKELLQLPYFQVSGTCGGCVTGDTFESLEDYDTAKTAAAAAALARAAQSTPSVSAPADHPARAGGSSLENTGGLSHM